MIIVERFNKLIYGINTIIKCGTWQPVKFQFVSSVWNEMIFYRTSELMLPTLIQRYNKKKNHFIFDLVQKRGTDWNFTGCLMPNCIIVLILYINLLHLSQIKICMSLRNMEPLGWTAFLFDSIVGSLYFMSVSPQSFNRLHRQIQRSSLNIWSAIWELYHIATAHSEDIDQHVHPHSLRCNVRIFVSLAFSKSWTTDHTVWMRRMVWVFAKSTSKSVFSKELSSWFALDTHSRGPLRQIWRLINPLMFIHDLTQLVCTRNKIYAKDVCIFFAANAHFKYSWLSLSRSRKYSLKYFEISIPWHIKFSELSLEIYTCIANTVEKRRNCSLGAISPPFHNILIPVVRFPCKNRDQIYTSR